jgi:hypothetical protein
VIDRDRTAVTTERPGPLSVDTVILPYSDPPTATMRSPPGDAGAVAMLPCVTVNTFVPIVIVPVLVLPLVLAWTENVADPDVVPVPLAVSHDCVEVAVQLQPVVVLTLMVPVAASPLIVRLEGVSR